MPPPGVNHRRVRVDEHGCPVHGLYDTVLDVRLKELVDAARRAGVEIQTRTLVGHDGILVAREVADAVVTALARRIGNEDRATEAELDLLNRLLAVLRDPDEGEDSGVPDLLPEVLERIGGAPSAQPSDLSDHGLLTGREGTDSLQHQLSLELASSDRVDWLVSFIKRSAVLLMQERIRQFLARGGTMRLVTTAYMGATDPAAMELLARISRENGRRLSIRFSRESGATRLHAKAYIHHRGSGFGSAYIGSANFSRPALTEGLEWTVRLSQAAAPGLWTKIEETFEQWWGDPDFIEYGLDESHPSHADFRRLVALEKGSAAGDGIARDSLPIFDLEPKPFQQAILDRIAAERGQLGLTRHLVVAATGTGKTMIAAFDFRRFLRDFREHRGRLPRMLYVAHTERILRQARLTFGHVLRDLNFGGLLVGGQDDRPADALFASIQSWRSRGCQEAFAPDHFDWVVVDEVHHGEAPTWRTLLEWMRPASLIGLTATPDRTDGLDITRHFGDRITAEIRLPEAIGRRLLVPFKYFGITDSIDLRGIQCSRRNGYANSMQLVERTYVEAGRQWIDGVLRAIADHVPNPHTMRAIGFCSGIEHARAMRDSLERHRLDSEARGGWGLKAESLDGSDSAERRDEVIGKLRRGEIHIVLVADLLNEGVDIPEIDTVLFMRPTQSRTIFMQQLGRGLRLHPSKDELTVLDFIGQYRREFRVADRYKDLLSDRSVPLKLQVEEGFVGLPPGCSITLQRIARERVMAAIEPAGLGLRQRLIEAAEELRDRIGRVPTMVEMVRGTGIDLRAFYATNAAGTWTGVRESLEAAVTGSASSLEPFLAPLQALATLTDRSLADHGLSLLSRLMRGELLSEADRSDRCTETLLVEFADPVKRYFGLEGAPSMDDVWRLLREHQTLREECSSIFNAIRELPTSPASAEADSMARPTSLRLHARYVRGQVLAGCGWPHAWTAAHQSGVLWLEPIRTYLMFVTLDKSRDGFTERTRYRDYAVSPTEFHWESQATATPASADGQRILRASRGEASMWLFLRKARQDEYGAEPFIFMGGFRPARIEGSQPMSVTGALDAPMPPEWFEIASRAR
jgi:superfamily II DNA or RNA helicase/HKD family nuclease